MFLSQVLSRRKYGLHDCLKWVGSIHLGMFGRVKRQRIGEKRLVESLVYLTIEVLFGIDALDGTINQVLVYAPKINS